MLEDKYYEEARELGLLMGKAGFDLVYGAGAVGTMWINAKAVKETGGKIIGVIPEKLYNLGVGYSNCDELFITKCMRSRKEKLEEVSDAFIALSGGFGTLDELSEAIVQKQLGYNDKAIVILNTDGFYDNLLKFFDEIIGKSFAIKESSEFYYVAQTPQEALNYIINYAPADKDVSEKFVLKAKAVK